MKKTILVFGLLIAALLILFQLGKYRMFEGDVSSELVISVAAILFFGLGVYFRHRWSKEEALPTKNGEIDYAKVDELDLSKREMEVLQELVNGLSNKEIAEKLFISESTIKTHVSHIYGKLDVNRRTQAILLSKELNLVK